jgi:predicted ATPase
MVFASHKAEHPPQLHNLPVQATSFVGRGEELAEIAELLADPACRLLTLLGPGGIGKTRLAVEVAARTEEDVADGIYFVPLQGVQPGYLVSAIADAAGVPSRGQEDPRAQLLRYLRDKEMLLVLDSFEHLLAGEIDLVSDILQAAPRVRLLVTSREVLNLEGPGAIRGVADEQVRQRMNLWTRIISA